MSCKYPFLCICCFFISGIARAQAGCTDTSASNYDPLAVTNDGSCIYPVTHYHMPWRANLSSAINESSGLVWTDGGMWTHNDSGNPAEIYKVDTADGHTIQTVMVDNYPNVDWEDITADSAYIYIGDHGNNAGDRTDLKVLKVAKADITTASVVHVNAQAISFSYADQTSFAPSSHHNFDCESLISIRDSLYVFTKDRGDMQTRVYKMPKVPGTYVLNPYTGYNVNGLLTGADYDPVTGEILLLGYMDGHIQSFLWRLTDYNGDLFFSGNKRRIEIGDGREWQTEGIAFISTNHFFVSCETTDSIPTSMYTGSFPLVATATANIRGRQFSVLPNPATDAITITTGGRQYEYRLCTVTGQAVRQGVTAGASFSIGLGGLPAGIYLLELQDDEGNRMVRRISKL